MEHHSKSKIKKLRKVGFRARARTNKGKKLHNRRRRAGRCITCC